MGCPQYRCPPMGYFIRPMKKGMNILNFPVVLRIVVSLKQTLQQVFLIGINNKIIINFL